MADDKSDHLIINPRQNEAPLLEGKAGRDLSSFIRDIKNGARVSVNHMDFFFGLAGRFVTAARPIAFGEAQNVDFNDNYLSTGSYISRNAITVSPHERHGKRLYTLEHFSASASPGGFLTVTRPYPIQWHLDHISRRSLERHGTFDEKSDMFLVHNNMVMMMLRIIEEEHYTGETTFIPFILPEKNGVLPGGDDNRMFIAASPEISRLKLARYEMFPQLEGTVRTFLGKQQMSPEMQKLRMQLLKYYNPPYRDAIGLSLDSYVYTEGSDSYEMNARRDLYEKAMLDIADIMASPLWHKAVRLPVHLRPESHFSLDID